MSHVKLPVRLAILAPLLAGLASCNTTAPDTLQVVTDYEVVDMSGHWEKDYQLSDDFNTEFNLYMFDIQRQLAPQSDIGNRNATLIGGSGSGSMQSVVGLARFTEEITRMPLLEIEQDRSRMKIDREEDFALLCEFFNRQGAVTQTPFGMEQCSWSRDQLLFLMSLSDGLRIQYRVSLSPNGRQLNITTSVSSDQVSTPMTISNYYRRYEPPENDVDCILTLTRNNVCRRANN